MLKYQEQGWDTSWSIVVQLQASSVHMISHMGPGLSASPLQRFLGGQVFPLNYISSLWWCSCSTRYRLFSCSNVQDLGKKLFTVYSERCKLLQGAGRVFLITGCCCKTFAVKKRRRKELLHNSSAWSKRHMPVILTACMLDSQNISLPHTAFIIMNCLWSISTETKSRYLQNTYQNFWWLEFEVRREKHTTLTSEINNYWTALPKKNGEFVIP